MSTQPKTTPLLEDTSLDPDVRALLEEGRAMGPSDAQLGNLAKRLSPALGIGLADLSGAAPAQGTAPVTVAGAKATAVVAGASTLFKFSTSGALKVIGLASLVGVGIFMLQPDAPAPAVREPAALVAPAPPAPTEPAPPAVTVEQLEPAPAPEPVLEAAPAKLKRAAPVPSEITLLQKAEGLRSNPAQALRVLRQHTRHYPDGLLAQEREVLAIEALLAVGRRPEAERRAARMKAAYPGSAQLRRVAVLLAEEPAR